MKIVIEIDEETYNDIKRGKIYSSYRDVPQESVVAIANGTPLQKEHGDAVSRDAVLDLVADYDLSMGQVVKGIHALPSVTLQPNVGHCKDCKYFEICSRWGDGCKTKEDGYCFLFEPKTQEVEK